MGWVQIKSFFTQYQSEPGSKSELSEHGEQGEQTFTPRAPGAKPTFLMKYIVLWFYPSLMLKQPRLDDSSEALEKEILNAVSNKEPAGVVILHLTRKYNFDLADLVAKLGGELCSWGT